MKAKTVRTWVSWALQVTSYCAGITIAIKELFFKTPVPLHPEYKVPKSAPDMFLNPPWTQLEYVPPPDWLLLLAVVAAVIMISVIMWDWRHSR